MRKKDLKNSSFVVNENSSIQQAMEAITDNQRGTAVVVDDDFCLEGIVSDGDIRRAMVSGATMIAPISKIINTDPVVITKEEYASGKSDEIFNSNTDIRVIPIIDENNTLVDVAVRDPDKRKEV
jgi:CBS domain-containing protein